MNRSTVFGAVSLGALALLVISAREASTQVQGSLPAYLKLQTATPGTAQTGHSNITGTAIAGQFKGGGAGLTSLDASNLASGTLDPLRLPVPLSLSGSDSAFILQAVNSSTVSNSAALIGRATATTGSAIGVFGESLGENGGSGVFGHAGATSGFSFGVYGVDDSPDGYGVAGTSTATAGYGTGGSFYTYSDSGIGAVGIATSLTGGTFGGYFQSNSTSGQGVRGLVNAESGNTVGVSGESWSPSGTGVLGVNPNVTGDTYGGNFSSASTTGHGVYGLASSTTGFNFGGEFVTNSSDGRGVRGLATAGTGLAVGGRFASASTSGIGVWSTASAASGVTFGVYGECFSASGYGLYAQGRSGASGTKSFRIDHPEDPENKYLLHYSAEGPEPLNVYSGNVTTDADGAAWVQLPSYFSEINKDFRYTLTVVDDNDFAMARIAKRIESNRFLIRTSRPRVDVSWEVKAVRNDRWVQKYGAPVEAEKAGREKGKYQHPELYGKPASMGIFYEPRQPGGGENRISKP